MALLGAKSQENGRRPGPEPMSVRQRGGFGWERRSSGRDRAREQLLSSLVCNVGLWPATIDHPFALSGRGVLTPLGSAAVPRRQNPRRWCDGGLGLVAGAGFEPAAFRL